MELSKIETRACTLEEIAVSLEVLLRVYVTQGDANRDVITFTPPTLEYCPLVSNADSVRLVPQQDARDDNVAFLQQLRFVIRQIVIRAFEKASQKPEALKNEALPIPPSFQLFDKCLEKSLADVLHKGETDYYVRVKRRRPGSKNPSPASFFSLELDDEDDNDDEEDVSAQTLLTDVVRHAAGNAYRAAVLNHPDVRWLLKEKEVNPVILDPITTSIPIVGSTEQPRNSSQSINIKIEQLEGTDAFRKAKSKIRDALRSQLHTGGFVQEVKPPLGIEPNYSWWERQRLERARSIAAAMRRYTEQNKSIPSQWIDELDEYLIKPNIDRLNKEEKLLKEINPTETLCDCRHKKRDHSPTGCLHVACPCRISRDNI